MSRHIHFSKDELKFIQCHSQMPRRELTILFNQEYGREVQCSNIKNLCGRKGWKTGRTGYFKKGSASWNKGLKGCMEANKTSFRKGHVPPNRRPLWAERISKDGYIEIKVPEINPHTGSKTRYRLKHAWLWEQAHGKIPKRHCLFFIDGDKKNCVIENLEIISRCENLQMNRLNYADQPDQYKPVVRTLGKLIARTIKHSREIGV